MALLKLDAWQVFLLLLAPAILAALVMFVSGNATDPRPTLIISQLLAFVFIGLFVYWIYSIGYHLARREPKDAREWARFAIALTLALIYRVGIDGYMFWLGLTSQTSIDLEGELWIVPLHLLATLAVLYCFYLNAKWLDAAEQKHPRAFKDFWRTFVLMALFPIGVWYIQPRLQRILGRR